MNGSEVDGATSLRAVAGKSEEKAGKLPPALNKLANTSQAVMSAVQQLHTRAQTARGDLTTELSRIPVSVSKVQATLRDGHKRVLNRLSVCEEELALLRTLVQSSNIELTQATASVRADAETLNAALPAVQSSVHGLVEAQRAQLASDKQAEETAQEALRISLALLSSTVLRLTEQGRGTLKDLNDQVRAVTDVLSGVSPQLTKMRDHLASEATSIESTYEKALTATQVEAVKPESESIAGDTCGNLKEQVAKPADVSVKALVQQLDTMGQQLRQHEQEVGPPRSKLDGTFKDMQSGPQLHDLCKASKHVLQKVGKLSSLGPLASSL